MQEVEREREHTVMKGRTIGKKEKEKKGTKQMKRGRINGRKEQVSTKPRKYRNNRKQISKQVYYPKNQGG